MKKKASDWLLVWSSGGCREELWVEGSLDDVYDHIERLRDIGVVEPIEFNEIELEDEESGEEWKQE